jgi:hypothetical protein
MTIWEFAGRGKSARPGVAGRALLLADILSWGTPRDFNANEPYGVRRGIYGVGVILDQEIIRPCVLAAQEKGFTRGLTTPNSALAQLLRDFADITLFDDTLVIPIPEPELHAAR